MRLVILAQVRSTPGCLLVPRPELPSRLRDLQQGTRGGAGILEVGGGCEDGLRVLRVETPSAKV